MAATDVADDVDDDLVYDIVLSFARGCYVDEGVCLQVRECLVEGGYRVFMDHLPEPTVLNKMQKIISNCSFFIACVSETYMKECERERDFALLMEKGRRLPIHCAFVNDVNKDDTSVKYLIGRKIFTDFYNHPFQTAFQQLLKHIQSKNVPRNGCWKGFNAQVTSRFKDKRTSVMISYSWVPPESKHLCGELEKRLSREGFKVWIDQKFMAGSIDESCAGAISGSCCLLCCVSKEYSESYECGRELDFAVVSWREQKMQLIPVAVPSKEGFDLEQFLKHKDIDSDKVQVVDFTSTNRFEQSLEKLLAILNMYKVSHCDGRSPDSSLKVPWELMGSQEEKEEDGEGERGGSGDALRGEEEHDNVSLISSSSSVSGRSKKQPFSALKDGTMDSVSVSSAALMEALSVSSSSSSTLSISNVISVASNWPSLSIKGNRLTHLNVIPHPNSTSDTQHHHQLVVALDCEHSQMVSFALNSKAKYEKVTTSVKGFTTQPISVCGYREKSTGQVRLAVLERLGEQGGTRLFTCNSSFGDKRYLGTNKETSFRLCVAGNGLLYVGMWGCNVLEVDLSEGTSQNEELRFLRTISCEHSPHLFTPSSPLIKVNSVSVMAVDSASSTLFLADNCNKLIVIYDFKSNAVSQAIEVPNCVNDMLVDSADNLLVLMRSNLFHVYSRSDQQFSLVRSEKLKKLPQENFYLRHMAFMNPSNNPHPSILVCTGHGKTSKIEYAANSTC